MCDVVFKSNVGLGDSPIFVRIGDVSVFKLKLNEIKELSMPEGTYNVTVTDKIGICSGFGEVVVSEKKLKTVIVIDPFISNLYRFIAIGILTMLFVLSLLEVIPLYISGIFMMLILVPLAFFSIFYRKKYFRVTRYELTNSLN